MYCNTLYNMSDYTIPMQQLNIVHKKVKTNNQVVSNEKTKPVEELLENKREVKGCHLALSRHVYRLLNSDTFYVESETVKDLYYFVRYEPSFHWCSCLDNSTRHVKCKHIFGVEYAIMKGTLRDIDKLPAEAKRYGRITTTVAATAARQEEEEQSKSYKDDDYTF